MQEVEKKRSMPMRTATQMPESSAISEGNESGDSNESRPSERNLRLITDSVHEITTSIGHPMLCSLIRFE